MGVSQQGWANAGRDVKRAALAINTLGTSEIKTGGGQYGDETVADSLFPKTVNNWALEDRTNAEAATDTKAKADAAAANPGPAPDLADNLLMKARSASLMRSQLSQGRKNSFGSF